MKKIKLKKTLNNKTFEGTNHMKDKKNSRKTTKRKKKPGKVRIRRM